MPKKEILSIGGQAVIEGVMMRSKDKVAVAVRNPKGKIKFLQIPIKYGKIKSKIVKIPIIRGIIMMWETLSIGFRALQFSANVATGEEEEIGLIGMATLILVSVIFGLGIFVLAPLFLTRLITSDNGLVFNFIDGVLRVLFLLGYLIIISFFKDVRRLFEYHGAEHMTVAAHEANKKLIPGNVKKYSRLHPRCGTNFLLIVFIVSIIIFSVINHPSFIVKFLQRVILIPLIAGIAYELLKFGGKYHKNPIVKLFVLPGLGLQLITTREPDKKQIEVAIAALKKAL
ncbi:MAG TPA: DUF1385 domain-containing protein [Candidatus Nanoarchaeia archaeon]|nr:DUF1385 domain-containing protein [Candidatus Nanoarchaeia archaeon]